MDEYNNASAECLNFLYEISHPSKAFIDICNALEPKQCTTPPKDAKTIIVTLGTTDHLTDGLYIPTIIETKPIKAETEDITKKKRGESK